MIVSLWNKILEEIRKEIIEKYLATTLYNTFFTSYKGRERGFTLTMADENYNITHEIILNGPHIL